ncbi:MAG TPA: PAS domain-containing protein, partial [Polyangiales bacterium]|nr:PAS domain-containing protein [Polyangiales bacterium]
MTPPVPALFRSIAEYTYDWETWHDADGVARWINRAVERITGYSVDECLQLYEYPLALAHEEDRAILARVLTDARAGGSGNDVEFRVRCKTGSVRWVA